MDHPELYVRLRGFIESVGIPVHETVLDVSCFLPGIQVRAGALWIDPARLAYVGDLLHEAGHLALLRPEQRVDADGEVLHAGDDVAVLEVATIAWSYAALKALGIAPEVVFHDGGYHGRAKSLLATYGLGVYLGSNTLVGMGLTSTQAYPMMNAWLRA